MARLMPRPDLCALSETCQFFKRLLQHRVAWSRIDFRSFYGFLDEDTIRRVAHHHYATAAELITWSDAQNPKLQTRMRATYDQRFSGRGYRVEEWLPMYLKLSLTTVFEVPSLARQLRRLEVRFADVTLPWVLKTLRNNPNLEDLDVHYGIYLPNLESIPTEQPSFPNVKKFSFRLAVRDQTFMTLAETCPEQWDPLSPIKPSWHATRTPEQDEVLQKTLLCFPNLKHVSLTHLGRFSSPQKLEQLMFPKTISSVHLRTHTHSNCEELSGLLLSLARSSGESITEITYVPRMWMNSRPNFPVALQHITRARF
jgi:hypothetical protein